MPLILLNSIKSDTKVALWKLTENETELTQLLLSKSPRQLEQIPVTNNRKLYFQRMAIRLLMLHFFDDVTLTYNEKGKPILSNGMEVSFSHSNEMVAMAINPHQPCGIDIEKIASKVLRIKAKFLNPVELALVDKEEHPEKLATIFWSCKEALYKFYSEKEVLFDQHLAIQYHPKFSNLLIGTININGFHQQLNLHQEIIDDYVLVFTA